MPYRKRPRNKWREKQRRQWEKTTVEELENHIAWARQVIPKKQAELEELKRQLKCRDDEIASHVAPLMKELENREAKRKLIREQKGFSFSRMFMIGDWDGSCEIMKLQSKVMEARISIGLKYRRLWCRDLDRECERIRVELLNANAIADNNPRLIEKKKREQAQEQERTAKRELVVAAAAAHFGKTREQADAIKRNLSGQTQIYPNCPYCDGALGEQPHADHIFPVSRGGLSTLDNLVLVCEVCNRKKTNKTLREFIMCEKLDRSRIEQVLERLGKRF